MKLYLYHTKDTNNTINKTLTDEHMFDIKLKDPENVINPNIMLNSREELTSNYAYIPMFERYYFIRDRVRVNRDLVQLLLEVDVLETYKEDILASQGNITRHTSSNQYYDGGSYLNEERKEHTIHHSDITPEFEETVLMTMIGG